VYALGLGDRVVGRTRFCRFPADVLLKPAVGGFLDASIEQIVRLQPTHLLHLEESAEVAAIAARFNIETVALDHRSVSGIKASLARIGAECGVAAAAEQILARLRAEEQELRERMKGRVGLRTMVIVGRGPESGRNTPVYLAGRDGMYSDILEMIGALNVNTHGTVAVPTVSAEGLRALAPEAIIELASVDDGEQGVAARMRLWQAHPNLPAVAHGRVAVLTQDFVTIPGPRYMQVARLFAEVLLRQQLDSAALLHVE
jgi:iron complex transport system substrate-binding protein